MDELPGDRSRALRGNTRPPAPHLVPRVDAPAFRSPQHRAEPGSHFKQEWGSLSYFQPVATTVFIQKSLWPAIKKNEMCAKVFAKARTQYQQLWNFPPPGVVCGLGFGVWCLGFGNWCLVFGVWCSVFGIWCLVFGVWCLVFGVWCLVFGVWCLVFGVWCLVFDV